eukprot:scaffold54737_cov66-Phaeocystis_antarctica.AAC.3
MHMYWVPVGVYTGFYTRVGTQEFTQECIEVYTRRSPPHSGGGLAVPQTVLDEGAARGTARGAQEAARRGMTVSVETGTAAADVGAATALAHQRASQWATLGSPKSRPHSAPAVPAPGAAAPPGAAPY